MCRPPQPNSLDSRDAEAWRARAGRASELVSAAQRGGVVANAYQGLHLVLAGMGFASRILLWLTVAGGFALRSSWTQTRIRRTTIYGVHQAVTLFGLCLGVFHGLAQLAVPGSSITLLDLVVPFVDAEDPIGI